MDGLPNLRIIKSKSVPQGFMLIRDVARELKRSTNAIYKWVKTGDLTYRQMIYWYDPKLKKNVLALSEDAIDIYRKRARDREESIEAAKQGEKEFFEELNEELKSSDDISTGDAKRIREINKMKKEKLELQKLENEVLLTDSVTRLVTDMGMILKQKLLSAVPRIASVTTACDDMHTNLKVIQDEFEIILKDLLTSEDVLRLCNKK